MRYHYTPPDIYVSMYGERYICDHPLYSACTLYLINDKGLAVIQQRFDPLTKATYWTEIDPILTDELYLHPDFKLYFDSKADYPANGLYPTVTIRNIMWALKMNPLPKQKWETSFGRSII